MSKYLNQISEMLKYKDGQILLLFIVAITYIIFGLFKVKTYGRKSILGKFM